RVVAGPRGDVEHLLAPVGAQLLDEELALGLRAAFPVDQLVPFLDERVRIFQLVMIGLTNAQWVVPKTLYVCSCSFHRLPYFVKRKGFGPENIMRTGKRWAELVDTIALTRNVHHDAEISCQCL